MEKEFDIQEERRGREIKRALNLNSERNEREKEHTHTFFANKRLFSFSTEPELNGKVNANTRSELLKKV